MGIKKFRRKRVEIRHLLAQGEPCEPFPSVGGMRPKPQQVNPVRDARRRSLKRRKRLKALLNSIKDWKIIHASYFIGTSSP
jgi:hypothetical protein